MTSGNGGGNSSGERRTPAADAPECVRLAEGLRELRARTGLSMTELAQRTHYSRSSWERYLNGKALPPRQAVEALSGLARQPAGRLLALWELAELAWSGRASGAASAPAQATPGPAAPKVASKTAVPEAASKTAAPAGAPSRWRSRRGRLVALLAAVVLVVAGVLVSVALGGVGGRARADRSGPASSPVPGCRDSGCEGRDPSLCDPSGHDVAAHSAPWGAWVKIRYSRTCGAVWAVVWHSKVGDQLRISVPPGDSAPRKVVIQEFDTERMVPTPMAATRRVEGARACLVSVSSHREMCFQA
ncbi:helix-turn-helix domain-containing protein [Streptomyces sp. NPDC059837]|uniref:helix-turn-helix domain-containing protein n=1 Tax=Streptomyces sp. NPDC059837 TaxID=3346968 RepID=UPI0036639ABF